MREEEKRKEGRVWQGGKSPPAAVPAITKGK